MRRWEQYFTPQSLEEAIFLLDKYKGAGKIIGGGTDLIPQFRDNKEESKYLVDVTQIPEMKEISLLEDSFVIGGAVTHAQLAGSQDVYNYAQVLAEATVCVGSPQIRNMGTISGNIVNAQPAADGAIALTALDAQVHITSADGEKVVPITELYRGVGKSKVDSTIEVISKIEFKKIDKVQNVSSAFERLASRKALALPMVNVAVCLKTTGGQFDWARIAIGPVAQMPFRPFLIEDELRGMPTDEESIRIIAEEVSQLVQPRSSKLRGSADYRKEMVKVLVGRALMKAIARLGSEPY